MLENSDEDAASELVDRFFRGLAWSSPEVPRAALRDADPEIAAGAAAYGGRGSAAAEAGQAGVAIRQVSRAGGVAGGVVRFVAAQQPFFPAAGGSPRCVLSPSFFSESVARLAVGTLR